MGCGNSQLRVTPKLKRTIFERASGVNLPSLTKPQDPDLNKCLYVFLQEIDEDLENNIKARLLQLHFKDKRYLKATVTINNQSYLFHRFGYRSFQWAIQNLACFNQIGAQAGIIPTIRMELKQFPKFFAIDMVTEQVPKGSQLVVTDFEDFLNKIRRISDVLAQMHRNHLAYQCLHPENLMLKSGEIFFANPAFRPSFSPSLIKFANSNFKVLDVLAFQVLALYLINPSLKSFDDLTALRVSEEEWDNITTKYEEFVIKQFNYDVPQGVIRIVDMLTQFELDKLLSMQQIHELCEATAEKGFLTSYKPDNFEAYQLFNDQSHKNPPQVVLVRNNKVKIYNLETLKLQSISCTEGGRPALLQSNVIYDQIDSFVYLFQEPSRILKVNAKIRGESQKTQREIEVFRVLKQFQLANPFLIKMEDPEGFKIFLFNQALYHDTESNEQYYVSLILDFKEEVIENVLNDEEDLQQIIQDQFTYKRVVKITQGPRYYHQRQFGYFFCDQQVVYMMRDNQHIFKNGIRYAYYDNRKARGHLKEMTLRCACDTEQVFLQMCQVNADITSIRFCVQVVPGTYLLHSQDNIYILDLNFSCFYTLASLKQIKSKPSNHLYCYEIKNIRLDIYQSIENSVFQFYQGHLHQFGKYKKDHLHLVFDVQTQNACISLVSCYSISQRREILSLLPASISYSSVILQQKQKNSKSLSSIRSYSVVQRVDSSLLNVEVRGKQCYSMFLIKLTELADVQQFLAYYHEQARKLANSDGFVHVFDYFIEEQESGFVVHLVVEEVVATLKAEIERRQREMEYIDPDQLIFMIKQLKRIYMAAQSNQLKNFQITLENICVTNTGIIKALNWYQDMSNHPNNFRSLVSTINQIARLQTDEQFEPERELPFYPGFGQHLAAMLQTKRVLISNEEMKQTQIQSLNSAKVPVMWVQYESSRVVLCYYEDFIRFVKLDLHKSENKPVKLRKGTPLVFDDIDTIYAIIPSREDKEQEIYAFTFQRNKQEQQIQGRKIFSMRTNVISQTLVLVGSAGLYIFGGYEIGADGNKGISNKSYLYSFEDEELIPVEDMPIHVVWGTGLYCKREGKIYVFGGISNELDLAAAEQLACLQYNIEARKWQIFVDFTKGAPYSELRPQVQLIGASSFVSLKVQHGRFLLTFWSLKFGGAYKQIQLERSSKHIQQGRTQTHNRGINAFGDSIVFFEHESPTLNFFKFLNNEVLKHDFYQFI